MTHQTTSRSSDTDIEHVIALLDGCCDLLRAATPETYQYASPLAYHGSLGKHYRHILDHFECFLRGLEGGAIRYDDRERDETLETDPQRALARTRDVAQSLRALPVETLNKRVTCVTRLCGPPDFSESEADSTVRRELIFLGIHTVHHQSMMAAILRERGAEIPDSFGKAPSTLHHEAGRRGNA